MQFASNSKIKDLPEFRKIETILTNLLSSRVIPRLNGNCVIGSELVCSLLQAAGIKSRIVECQLTIKKTSEPIEIYFVGFDNVGFKGELDTHLVVITETKIPILIDVSISQYLPESNSVVVEESCINSKDNIIGNINLQGYELAYQIKKSVRWPSLHQKNLLERLEYENETNRSLKFLKMIAICAIGISIFNFFLNWVQIFLKLIHP